MEVEKAHEAMVLIGDLLALAASGYMLWKLYSMGNNSKLLQMRAIRAASRFSKSQAEFWTDAAAKCDTAYIKIAS